MTMRPGLLGLGVLLLLGGCPKPADTGDTGTTDTGDTGTTETGTTDTGTSDTGTSDTGTSDTGTTDTGTTDTGATDTGTHDTGDTAVPVDASITVSDATPGLSTQLFVDEVAATQPSQLVLNEGTCGAPGSLDATLTLSAGTHTEVEISSDTPFSSGIYCVSLHDDTTNTGTFDPIDDPITQNLASEPVEADWAVTIADGTPAVRIVLGNSGTTDYLFQEIVPDRFTTDVLGSASLPAHDPAVTLYLDVRYEVVWPSGHPFSIVSNTGTDTSLLVPDASFALDTSGALESDPDIAWVDDGTHRTERFTATTTLQGEPGLQYRCGNHTNMRGNLTITAAR